MHYKEVKAILSPQNGMNIYRGLDFPSLYSDARSKCYRIKHDFEDVEVKEHADDLLEHALKLKRTRSMIQTGQMTDPYLPLEEELQLMRRCLNQIDRFEFGVVIKSKSKLILRDLEILDRINKKTKCVVVIPFATCDDKLSEVIDPGAANASERLNILQELAHCHIPTIVSLEPIMPFINDSEENLTGIMEYADQGKAYGVLCEMMGILLREGSREYFYDRLDETFPGLSDRYVETYGDETEVLPENCETLIRRYRELSDKCGMIWDKEELKRYMREYKNKTVGEQLSFDFGI